MNYKQQVRDLNVRFCNLVENTFTNEEVIEFDNPFIVYITEENSYDDSSVKASHIVKTLSHGKYLGGEAMGSEFDDLSIYDLESIVEVAHILDIISNREYKVITESE